MDKKDKVVLRKIKESGNYNNLLKLKKVSKDLLKKQSLYKIYIALKKPEGFVVKRENNEIVQFKEYLKSFNIKFVF